MIQNKPIEVDIGGGCFKLKILIEKHDLLELIILAFMVDLQNNI